MELINEYDGRPQFDNYREEGLEAYYRYIHCRNLPFERHTDNSKIINISDKEIKSKFQTNHGVTGFIIHLAMEQLSISCWILERAEILSK